MSTQTWVEIAPRAAVALTILALLAAPGLRRSTAATDAPSDTTPAPAASATSAGVPAGSSPSSEASATSSTPAVSASPAMSDAALVGPPAPPPVKVGKGYGPYSMLIERRYQHDSSGKLRGYMHRFITGPVMSGGKAATPAQLVAANEAGFWPPRPTGGDGVQPRGPGGCPDDVQISVLTLNHTRGELLPADLDCDGVCEPADLALLAAALAGPNQPAGGGSLCKPTDHDNDGDTDLADFAILQDSGGPAVPARLEYSLDGGSYLPLFGGGDLVAGAPPAIIAGWTAGQTLTLRASGAYPSFGGGWYSASVASDDPQRVLVLLDGDNLAQQLALAGAQPPFAGQGSLAQALTAAGYLAAGVVQLAAHQSLLFFELTSTNQSSSAFDFQDAGLLVEMPCAVGSEIVLRDSIGVDSSMTDGNYAFGSYKIGVSNPQVVPIKLTSNEAVQLKSIRMIFSQYPSETIRTWPWDENLDYRLNVWSNWNAILANHFSGDVLTTDQQSSEPTSEVWGIGVDWQTASNDPYTTYAIDFNLESFTIDLDPGEEKWIGITLVVPGTPIGGVIESQESGTSDMRCWGQIGAPTCVEISSQVSGEPKKRHSGRVGVRVLASTR